MAPVIIEPYEMPAAFSVTAISLHQHFRGSVIFPFVVLCRCRIFISHPEDGFRIPVDAAIGAELYRHIIQAHFRAKIPAARVVCVKPFIVLRGFQSKTPFFRPFFQISCHVLYRNFYAYIQNCSCLSCIECRDEEFLAFPEKSLVNRESRQPASLPDSACDSGV